MIPPRLFDIAGRAPEHTLFTLHVIRIHLERSLANYFHCLQSKYIPAEYAMITFIPICPGCSEIFPACGEIPAEVNLCRIPCMPDEPYGPPRDQKDEKEINSGVMTENSNRQKADIQKEAN